MKLSLAIVSATALLMAFSFLHADAQVIFTRDLTIGSSGSDVKALQQELNRNPQTQLATAGPGSPGQETSYFGPVTKAAVMKFQDLHKPDILVPVGLSSGTGYVGPFTRAKLHALIAARGGTPPAPLPSDGIVFTKDLTIGSSGADVKALQQELNNNSQTRLAATGPGSPGQETTYFGPITKVAVIKFQNLYAQDVLIPIGLANGTGYVGSATRKQLNDLIADRDSLSPSPQPPSPTPTPTPQPTPPLSTATRIIHTWTFSDGKAQISHIFNRTDQEYLNYIASVEARCRAIPITQFRWSARVADSNSLNWQNYGIPDCTGTPLLPTPQPTPTSVCGNAICETGETQNSCPSDCGQVSTSTWILHTWTFSDGAIVQSKIFNRTDQEYLNYVASIEAQCRAIPRSRFVWKPNAANSDPSNWQNYGIPNCSSFLSAPICGNAICETGETSAVCAQDCPLTCTTTPSKCTTAFSCAAAGYAWCSNACYASNASCPVLSCGDNIITAPEECEIGVQRIAPTCIQKGFDSGGPITCSTNCRWNTDSCVNYVCGNNVREGTEACDGNTEILSCTTLDGYKGTKTRACNPPAGTNACQWGSFGNCIPNEFCGDGTIQTSARETCEGSNLGGNTCRSLGYDKGTVSCNTNCTLNTAQCSNIDSDEPVLPGTGSVDIGIVFPGASWAARNPEDVGLKQSGVDQFVSAVRNFSSNGMVIKDGYQVASWGSLSDKNDWASAAKPVHSTLLFFAVKEGKLSGIGDRIASYVNKVLGKSLRSADLPMTFRHLSNMTSGYTLPEGPGEAWAYNDYAIKLYVRMLYDGVYGTSNANQVAINTNRLGALGFQDGSIFSSRDGYGLSTSVRDFARIGWLWANKGYWNGRQLFPKEYFDLYVNVQVPSNLPRTTGSSVDDYLGVGTIGGGNDLSSLGPGVYGANFWFNANKKLFPDLPADTYQAVGHWGTKVLTVFPSQRMVVVHWQSGTRDQSGYNRDFNSVARSLINAVVAQPEPTPTPTSKGKIIVDPTNPEWLIYENGKPFFMCGPGDPEDFLYRGTLLNDGTRSGDQLNLINKLKGTGANSIYLQAIRSHGGDGNNTHNPFINHDPTKGLNAKVLDQWESWFSEMDRNSIVIYFFFYDDSANIWNTGDIVGSAEKAFIEGIVNRFEHHKNLIWVVAEEYGEKFSATRVSNIAQVIRSADNNQHVIGVHKNESISFSEFANDPNIGQFAMQINSPSTPTEMHVEVLKAWNNASGRYNLNMSEAANQPIDSSARKMNWAAAMAGAYVTALGWTIDNTPKETLVDCGRLVNFMESTTLNKMSPRDDLASAGTQYLLANPGQSYIAYSASLSGDIGIKNMSAGTYSFKWLDILTGYSLTQTRVQVLSGTQNFKLPPGIGKEVAVFILKE